MTAQDGTFSTQLWGNDNINPSNTLYAVTFRDFLGNEMGPILYSITGASVNLNTLGAASGTIPPVFVFGAVLLNPLGPQIVAQNITFTGTINPSTTAIFGSGVTTGSSLTVNNGSLVVSTNDAYLELFDNGFGIFVQAGGPRPLPLLAQSTLTLPDLTQHTSTPTSGFLLGAKPSNITASHIPSYGTSSNDGYVLDSGVTASGGNLGLLSFTSFLNWTNGTFNGALLPVGGGLSNNRSWPLPDFSPLNMSGTIASGTAVMTTALIASGAVGATVTVAASGVLATDVIAWSFNAAPAANPAELIVSAWPTAGNVNFQYANPTAAGITPNAATLNWKVIR
jgi:hypothetical protein